MDYKNISNPTVLMSEFANWLTRNNDALTNVSEMMTQFMINSSPLVNLAAEFHAKFPNGVTFQVSDIDSFELQTDEIAIYWLTGNGGVAGVFAEPVDWDPEEVEHTYTINDKAYSINGNEYDAYTLIPYLIENIATNNCVATAIQLVKNGQVASLSDLDLMLPSFGARVTDTAKTYLGYIANYTENFSSPTGLLGFIRDTYVSANSAQVDPESGQIIFQGNSRFILKSAFTLAWGSVLGAAAQVVGAMAIASANAILGAIATGAGFIISSISSVLTNKTDGKVNTGALNRSYDATLMSRPNFVLTNGSYCYDHLNEYGVISYSTPGAMFHFAKNGTPNPTYSMAVIPELDVTSPFKYDADQQSHVRQAGVPDEFSIIRGSGSNPTYTVTWSDPSHNIMKFVDCYGDSPVTPNDCLMNAASGIAYFIYNVFGCLSTNSFTVTNGWWGDFKTACPLSTLKNANYIQTVQYMNTIASVLAVISSGQILTVRRTSFGQDKDQWVYEPDDSITRDLDSILSWEHISQIIEYVQTACDKYDTYHGLDEILSTSQTAGDIICLDNYINIPFYYKAFFFEPPVTTLSSVAGLVATIVVAAAVIIAGVVVAKKAIQNVILPRMTKKYDEINTKRIQMQTTDYLDSHTVDEQLKDQKDLLKATRKYNFFAKVLGLSTISYTTGWENLDGRSSLFNSMSVETDGSSLLDSVPDIVQPESDTSCDNDTINNAVIYKILTGSANL